ncbi:MULTISPECIES: MFS transporter [Bacillus]|uniref:MFS transporter n=1 Tax=Bacillus TaxID=1386 RepID=UPI000C77215F|nr:MULTISPECIES: MFS transporter [Bacillus]PLR87761.1 MFS transporter [Bacillus sp. V33-4]RSK55206.1 MFS transporter [Bacillus canaveralius]
MSTLNSKTNRFVFLLVSFILWFSHFIYVPILSPYIESMGGKYTFIGIVLSSYGLMQFIFRLPIGICSDLIKLRRPFIIFGMLTSAFSCLLFALTDSLGLVLLSRSLAGVAAATWVAFTVLYSSYFADREIHRATGSISFVIVLAQLLGMSVSGYIATEWGWHVPFWVGGIVSIIGAALSFFIYEPKEGIVREPVKIKDLISVMREPLLLKISLLSILAHSIIFTTMFGFIPAFALNIGLQASDISLIVFSFMIPHAIATLFMGKVVVPIFGQWKSLKIAFLATSFFTFVTPFVDSKIWLCMVQAFNGFSLGLLFPLLLGMAIESISHEKRATAMGTYQALYAIGMFTGPFLAGVLNSMMGIAAGFYFAGILGLLAALLVVFWNNSEEHYKSISLNSGS